ncbi:hypothetical protein HPB52_011837 [Rhipicephalus sanguineus]|uniref:Uncharacterized protein n=1 Tax=Rhipicephalus sanguineus TaxID=34632 RepID=A0A9D4PJ79_RHISA|nr:hypothetical protein HPB52_011837 [Rhipicephalus sanguineus]
MANSDQLRKKRGAIRAGVTRALTLLTDLLQQQDPDASQISGHMDYLKDREEALSQLDDVILATTDEQNLDQGSRNVAGIQRKHSVRSITRQVLASRT